MGQRTKANGSRENIMERALTQQRTEPNTKESGRLESTTVLVLSCGLTAPLTKVSGETVAKMEGANLQGVMAQSTKEIG